MPFFDHLSWYLLPTVTLFILISLAISVFLWLRKVTNQKLLKQDQEIIGYALNTISLFYCVLVGLIVIDVQGERDDVQATIIREAAILVEISHAANTFDFLGKNQINEAIKQYARTALETELPLMQKKIDFSYGHYVHADLMWKALKSIKPENFQELAVYQKVLDNMSLLTDTRFKRFSSIEGRMTPFLWVVLIYGAILVITCSLLFVSESWVLHALHLSFNVTLIAFILFLISVLDSPFDGPAAVSMQAFEKILYLTQ